MEAGRPARLDETLSSIPQPRRKSDPDGFFSSPEVFAVTIPPGHSPVKDQFRKFALG
jgi:hypothetical protein